ncbi:hypothetical protein JJ691_103320 [Kutzneria sp. CA-103260]|nr:hypothetical protein JJ691_103320 [Kutzneria sp. CA-103260]
MAVGAAVVIVGAAAWVLNSTGFNMTSANATQNITDRLRTGTPTATIVTFFHLAIGRRGGRGGQTIPRIAGTPVGSRLLIGLVPVHVQSKSINRYLHPLPDAPRPVPHIPGTEASTTDAAQPPTRTARSHRPESTTGRCVHGHVPLLAPLTRQPRKGAGHGSIGVCVCKEIMSITDWYISSPSRDWTSFR